MSEDCTYIRYLIRMAFGIGWLLGLCPDGDADALDMMSLDESDLYSMHVGLLTGWSALYYNFDAVLTCIAWSK